jgi:hypothetical protein
MRQLITGAFDRILDGRVDLILYRSVLRKTASHGHSLR